MYLFKIRDEYLIYFKIYKDKNKNQFERMIKRLRSDHDGEYLSNEINSFCEEHDIIHEKDTSLLSTYQ